MKNIRKIFLLGVVFLCFFNGTCDRTVLTGRIVPQKSVLRISETIPLALELPSALDGVYRVAWFVDPEDAGRLEYKEYSLYLEKNQCGKEDRIAHFTALKKGKCTIRAMGFYRQTNPQPIARTDLFVE